MIDFIIKMQVFCVFLQKSNVFSGYLKYFMKTLYMENQIKNNSKGSKVYTLTISGVQSYLIPLSPLKEQQIITKKLDRMFLKTSRAKEIISKSIEDIENRVSELLSLMESISLLEKSILDKAFRGKI